MRLCNVKCSWRSLWYLTAYSCYFWISVFRSNNNQDITYCLVPFRKSYFPKLCAGSHSFVYVDTLNRNIIWEGLSCVSTFWWISLIRWVCLLQEKNLLNNCEFAQNLCLFLANKISVTFREGQFDFCHSFSLGPSDMGMIAFSGLCASTRQVKRWMSIRVFRKNTFPTKKRLPPHIPLWGIYSPDPK